MDGLKRLDQLTIADLEAQVKALAWMARDEFNRQMQRELDQTLHDALTLEFDRFIGASAYKRSPERTGYRNGTRPRNLLTQFGPVRLSVPRDREGRYQPGVIERYQQRSPAVDEHILEMFLHGVSTRQVGPILEGLLGWDVSASTVSRIARRLDEPARAFHHRALPDTPVALVLDGVYVPVKGATGPRRVATLCAMAVHQDGQREMVDFLIADSESEQSWKRMLDCLYRRGLQGTKLRVITVDGCPGLVAAVRDVYPYVPIQRCWVHKMRNLQVKVRKKHWAAFGAQVRAIRDARTLREARQRFRELERTWGSLEPKAVACLRQDLDELLTLHALRLPLAARVPLRTTNHIERLFREVKARTRPMAAFSNPASADRILFARFVHTNARWKTLKPDPPLAHFTHKS